MTKVKICGLKTLSAVQTAVISGADFIGFVFARSKRQISIEQAQILAKNVPKSVKIVGVFVSPSLEELEEHIKKVPLDLVQIHGDFDEGLLSQISKPVIRAIPVTSAEIASSKADYLLFDAPVAGSGKTFDWRLLQQQNIEQPFFLAGGLTADNVAQAQTAMHPFALDVSSGVETNGQKDLDKIRLFIESVKK